MHTFLLAWLVARGTSGGSPKEELRRKLQTRLHVAAHQGYIFGVITNTLPACKCALRRGADIVEFDLRATLYGQVVVYYDEHLEFLLPRDFLRL